MKVLIIANRTKPDVGVLIEEVTAFCRDRGAAAEVRYADDRETASYPTDIVLAVTLGGDGTVLYAARHLPVSVPVLAVNLGTVGFITESARENWKHYLDCFFRNDYVCSPRLLLSVGLCRGGQTVSYPALNDAVICAGGISKLVSVDLAIDGFFVGRFRADGLVCATPTGSTAYSAAAGGPILDPEMKAMVISPVCPYTLSNRPLVIPAGKTVTVEPSADNKTELILTLDGQEVIRLNADDRLKITISDRKLFLIKDPKRHFYDVLRSKLNWSGGTHA